MLQLYKKLLVSFLFLLIGVSVKATHIVGGTLTYDYLGGASYRITLDMYRDCAPGNIDFAPTARILVMNSSGSPAAGGFIDIPFTSRSKVNPYIDTCAVKSNLCLERAVYSIIVNNFPPITGGYYLYFDYQWRNYTITNINSSVSNTVNDTWVTHIPDNSTILYNSSPIWVQPPPVFVCQGKDIEFNHSAVDKDGDSLVYSFYAPFRNYQSITNGQFVCTRVPYLSGYDSVNSVNPGGPGLTITSGGIIHGSPNSLGQYVAGVKCSEYRNGVLIGETYRDFQFNVISCPPLAQAIFTTSSACSGQTVSFKNSTGTSGGSGGATTYNWDFGDPSVLTDVSTAQNPSPYSYPGFGPYTVTLIINKNSACADTTTQTVNLSYVKSAYTFADSLCVSDSIHFTSGSTVAANSTITGYQWDFGDPGSGVNNTSTLQNPAHLFSYAGATTTYTVSLITSSAYGCKDTLKKVVTVFGVPIVNAIDTISCANTNAVGIAGSVLNAPGGTWTIIPAPPSLTPGILSPNANTLNPTYTPTADEVAQGYAKLVLTSTGNNKCVVKTDTMRINFYSGPTANAGPDLVMCKGVSGINLNGTITVAYGALWTPINGTTGTISNPTSLVNAFFTPSSADIAAGKAFIKLTTTQNGNCTPAYDTVKITFANPPFVTASSANDTSCVTVPFGVSGVSSTNSGTWTTNGDGSFANTNQASTIYTPGLGDATKGFVILHYNSANNGSCKAKSDSVKVILLSAPLANAGPDTTICINKAITPLHGSVALASGGVWSTFGSNPAGTFANPNNLNTTYTPSASDLSNGYAYAVLTAKGLIQSCPTKNDTMKITFTTGPTAVIQSIGDSINVCVDTSSISLKAIITLATGVTWGSTGTGIFTPANSLNTSYAPSKQDVSKGFVILYVQTTGNGICSPSFDSVKVKFYGVPSVNTSSTNDTACTSNTIPIKVTTATGSGYWTSTGNGTFSPNFSTLNGSYTLGSTDKNPVKLIFHSTNNGGCKSQTDTLKIAIIPGPNTAFNNTGACPKDPMNFTDASTTTNGTVTDWKWMFGDNTSGTGATTTHNYPASGTYSVTLITTSSNGCKDTLVKPITVYNNPKADFTTPVICLYQAFQFKDGSTVVGSTITNWKWAFSNGHSSTIKNPVDSFGVQTGSSATLIVTSAQGCRDTITKTLNVLPQPTADFSANHYYAQVGQVIDFKDLTSNSVSWTWNFSDNSSDVFTQNPSHSFNVGGVYPVKFMITDANGCKDTVIKDIIISLPPQVPSGFSPNDDGKNDVFSVLGGPFTKCHMRIYNNWGELIFESFEQKYGWDGKRNGIDQPLGVYVWVVDTENESENKEPIKYVLHGDVTLLR